MLSSYLGDSFGIPVRAKNPQLAKKWLETIVSVAQARRFSPNMAIFR